MCVYRFTDIVSQCTGTKHNNILFRIRDHILKFEIQNLEFRKNLLLYVSWCFKCVYEMYVFNTFLYMIVHLVILYITLIIQLYVINMWSMFLKRYTDNTCMTSTNKEIKKWKANDTFCREISIKLNKMRN